MTSRAPGPLRSGARSVPGGRDRSRLWIALLALTGACRSASGDGYLERHFDGDVWAGAFREQFDHPSQVLPAAELLLATPIARIVDRDLSEDALDPIFTGGNTLTGDALVIGLGATVLGFGIVDSLGERESDSLEIGLESLLATTAVTGVLKVTVGRTRPDEDGSASFPSGHSAFAFSAATFLARAIDDASDGSCDKLGYLFYLPAVYVADDRVEGQRHFTSDVTFGAFLGIFVTNWVYNAHRDDGDGDRPLVAPSRKTAAWRVTPVFDGNEIAIGLNIGL